MIERLGRRARHAGGRGSTDADRRYRRVAWAVLASVLLHGAVVTAWYLHRPSGPRAPQPLRQAMEVQWITAAPEASVPPAPRRSAPAVAQQAKVPSVADRLARRPPFPAAPTAQAPGRAGAAPSSMALPIPGSAHADATAAAPQRPASESRGEADAPVRWSAEAVGRADRQEREWQRRHGSASPAGLAARAASSGTTPLGAGLTTREWRGGDGARVAQVQGPGGGTYCVRLPSANRLPELGAAPRVAPVGNCP